MKPLSAEDGQLEQAAEDGFTRGVAWAIWLCDRWQIDSSSMLKESSLTYQDFKKARVFSGELKVIRKLCKKRGMPL